MTNHSGIQKYEKLLYKEQQEKQNEDNIELIVGCISLELISPAKYMIPQYKVAYLQYILQQEEQSLILRFLHSQHRNPTEGEWFLLSIKHTKISENLSKYL